MKLLRLELMVAVIPSGGNDEVNEPERSTDALLMDSLN